MKEQVYLPDWTSPERLAYTNLLFDLLSKLLPAGVEGSVSTLPGSFKGFHLHPDALKTVRNNLWHCVEHIAHLAEQTGRKLHLGLEPEPLCLLESSGETIQLFDRLRIEHPRDPRLAEHLGVNYDTCHFAVNFEEPQNALPCLCQHGIKISKIHLSSALKVHPTVETREALKTFADDVYLHQVVVREPAGNRNIYYDLPDALADPDARRQNPAGILPEWRIHFHVPLHAPHTPPFENTSDHLLGGAGSAGGKSEPLLASGNGNLHLGGVAAGTEKPQRRRTTRRRIRLDAAATGGTRTRQPVSFLICSA